jgi:hypothetical protein
VIKINTVRYNLDGTTTTSSVSIDPSNPANPERRPKPVRPIPGHVFIARFTPQEYAAIRQAAAAQLAQGNGQLSMWIDTALASGFVDPSLASAHAAKAALVSAGLLTQERADVIFVP